ncbi:MAG TPA: OmpA family protein, partial [Polyangiales bacterium]|nr:OmpA family protein [Polyangiales bacterium]
ADQLGADVLAAVGILDRWEIGIDLPLSWLRSGESTVLDASDGEFGVGDLHVSTKLALLARDRVPRPRGFGFGVLLDAYVPTGQDDRLQGEGFRFEPALVLDYAFRAGPRIGLQAGYRVRPKVELMDSKLDDAVALGAGIDVPVDADRHVHALAEVTGDIGVMHSDWSKATYPIEALLGARYLSTGGLMLQGAFGMGVNGGIGAPDYRVLLGASYRARTRPAPEPEPEPVYEVAEPKDSDGDGILDRSDKCPDQPEDQDGFSDADGCKDPDDDGDGVLDEHDACPREAEDSDGFADDDGCPDPDNDADGLLDAADKCPQEPETQNGFADTDGCPDEAPTQARITCDRIAIQDTVLFETGSDRIDARSYGLLDQVAAVMNAAPDVKRLRVEGHTDNAGRKKANLDLSRRRAAAVRSYLIEKQVASERLESEGYGDTKPIAPNKTRTGRAQNRRVDFIVAERSGACADVK